MYFSVLKLKAKVTKQCMIDTLDYLDYSRYA